MMKIKGLMKRIICIAMVTAVITTIGGCGSNTGSGSSESTTGASAGAASGSGVKEVKVGTGNSMPPYCSLDDSGKPTGYDVAVLKEIDSRLDKYSFNIESMDFNTLMVSIDSGALDIVSHQLVKSDARKQKYLFPEQYYCLSPMSLSVKKNSGIKSLADMAGKTINQSPTSYEYSMLMAYNDSHPDGKIKVNAVSDITTADMYKQVANGQVDATLTYQSTYDEVQKQLKLDNLEITDVVLVEDTYLMVSKGNDELCKAVDQALKDMLKDGTLSKLSNQYLGQDIFTKYSKMVGTAAK